MATVTNWIDHLNKPADQVAGAVYPGAGSSEGLLVIQSKIWALHFFVAPFLI